MLMQITVRDGPSNIRANESQYFIMLSMLQTDCIGRDKPGYEKKVTEQGAEAGRVKTLSAAGPRKRRCRRARGHEPVEARRVRNERREKCLIRGDGGERAAGANMRGGREKPSLLCLQVLPKWRGRGTQTWPLIVAYWQRRRGQGRRSGRGFRSGGWGGVLYAQLTETCELVKDVRVYRLR